MNKKGQVYIIAALIIVILIVGLGTIYNYAKAPAKETYVYDLSKEIDFESSKVIEQGIITAGTDIQAKVQEIIDHYQKTIVPRTKTELIAVLVGRPSTGTKIYYYRPVESSIEVNTDSSGAGTIISPVTVLNRANCVTSTRTERTITVRIRGNQNIPSCEDEVTTQSAQQPSEFIFDLKEGENFFIVLIKEKAGETFVARQE